MRFFIRGLNPTSLDSSSLISKNTWYHFTATYNASNGVKKIFIDGIEIASHVTTGQLVAHSGTASIGGETTTSDESDRRFNGDLDEIRSFPGVLSADWIKTEYNNQSNPGSFISVSSELSATDLCMILPIELIHFTVEKNNYRNIEINWSTASEKNNSHFLIEKSKDGQQWEMFDG